MPLLTVRQFAELTNTHYKTIYQEFTKGIYPPQVARKIGGRIRFNEVEFWLWWNSENSESQKAKTNGNNEAEEPESSLVASTS